MSIFDNPVDVHNLANDEVATYTNMLPSRAVMNAWLASIGRNNTWEYEELYSKYSHKLTWGRKTVAIGDFCALRLYQA
jgi:hypothetical protein